jgi:hypothetical protein
MRGVVVTLQSTTTTTGDGWDLPPHPAAGEAATDAAMLPSPPTDGGDSRRHFHTPLLFPLLSPLFFSFPFFFLFPPLPPLFLPSIFYSSALQA